MQNCQECYGKKWLAKIDKKTGLQVTHTDGRRVWKCWRCGHVQEDELSYSSIQDRGIRANILYIDLEVSKSIYYTYGRKVPSKFLPIEDLIQEYFIISWAASYAGNDRVWSSVVSPEAARSASDKEILQPLSDLMNSADIIAGHNADSFDMKKINTRFLLNGISPILDANGKPKRTLDTLKMARRAFAFEGNGLDYLCQRFGITGKDHIDGDDWRAVMRGDEKTLAKIHKYNRGDVVNGKKLLKILQPYSGKPSQYGAVTLTDSDPSRKRP